MCVISFCNFASTDSSDKAEEYVKATEDTAYNVLNRENLEFSFLIYPVVRGVGSLNGRSGMYPRTSYLTVIRKLPTALLCFVSFIFFFLVALLFFFNILFFSSFFLKTCLILATLRKCQCMTQ